MKVFSILLLSLIIIIDILAVFDLAQRQIKNKRIWLSIILLLPVMGAILYFNARKM